MVPAVPQDPSQRRARARATGVGTAAAVQRFISEVKPSYPVYPCTPLCPAPELPKKNPAQDASNRS